MNSIKTKILKSVFSLLVITFVIIISNNLTEAVTFQKTNKKAPPTKESILNGKKLFTANCVPCHGESGKGDGAAGKFLPKKPANFQSEDIQKISDEELFKILSSGKGNMPAYQTVFTEKDRWDLINYLRTFSKK